MQQPIGSLSKVSSIVGVNKLSFAELLSMLKNKRGPYIVRSVCWHLPPN